MCYTFSIVGEDMEGKIFVNLAVQQSIQNYLNFKNTPNRDEFNTFLVMVVRTLVLIYGELDIVNPYRTNNERGFDENLKKFGYSLEKIAELKEEMQNFFANPLEHDVCRDVFLSIQMKLIDMFALRKSHVFVSEEEINQFKNLLYTKEDTIPVKVDLYNRYTPNSDVLLQYLSSKLFEAAHDYKLTEFKEITLGAEAYQLAGFNAVEVMNMKEEEILNINNKVYHFFRIKDTDINKRGRLDEAIEYYKKYGNTITSGNGYVDLLLLLSVITTGLMLMVLIGIQFMR